MGKRLTKELIEIEGKNLIGKSLMDFSPLKLKNVNIIDLNVEKYSVKVNSQQGEYEIFYPYTTFFKFFKS